jgi:hypothetical protein
MAKAMAPKPGENMKWKERWAQFQNANLVVKAVVPNGIPEVKKP